MKQNNYKEKYNSISMPKEVETMIHHKINNHSKKRKFAQTFPVVAIGIATLIFTLSLNTNSAFATTVSKIPILGKVAQILTFTSYTEEKENGIVEVAIPKVTDLEDKDYEEQINNLIQTKVNAFLKKAEIRTEEYKEAFIETGGTEEEFNEKNLKTEVGYEVKSKQSDRLSFLVYCYDPVASAYAEYMYHNIDLMSNKELTLESLLGLDYIHVISDSVKNGIEEMKKNPDNFFFEDYIGENLVIRKDMDFYINENNHIVVIFNKYEIAPGSMDRIEFEITNE